MKRLYWVGLSLCAALLLTTLLVFGYQQQAAAQIDPETETEIDGEIGEEGEIVEITPVRLDGQVVLSVTVRVGEELTVTTPITLDVASWIADLEGSTEITAGVLVGEPATTFTAGVTSTLPATVTPTTPTATAAITPDISSDITATVDVTITRLITPLLSLVELIEEEVEEEPVLRGEVLAGANLREGPSIDTPVIGAAQPGDIVVIVDTNVAGDWYNLEGGEWIAGFLVQLLEPEEDELDEDLPADEVDEADEDDLDENGLDENGVELNDVDDADETDADETDAPADLEDANGDGTESDLESDLENDTDNEAEETPLLTPTATPMPESESATESGTAVAGNDAVASDSAVNNSVNNASDTSIEYRVAVITGLLNLVSGVEAMGGLMDDPQMLSAGWNENIKDQATVIRGSYQEISALTPPGEATNFHADLLSALDDCDGAMDLLTNGLDSLDMNSLDQAATLMMQCGGKMEMVISDYPEFLE